MGEWKIKAQTLNGKSGESQWMQMLPQSLLQVKEAKREYLQ